MKPETFQRNLKPASEFVVFPPLNRTFSDDDRDRLKQHMTSRHPSYTFLVAEGASVAAASHYTVLPMVGSVGDVSSTLSAHPGAEVLEELVETAEAFEPMSQRPALLN